AAHRCGDIVAAAAAGDVDRTAHGGGGIETVGGENTGIATHRCGDVGVLALQLFGADHAAHRDSGVERRAGAAHNKFAAHRCRDRHSCGVDVSGDEFGAA